MKINVKSFVNIGIVVLLAFFISGCFGDTSSSKPADGTSDVQAKSRKTTAVYYDFEDVLIPMELKVVEDKTMVVSTPGFTSGIITLKGRIERRSLFNFFTNNMQKDNWNILSQIKSPGTTILVFQKAARISVITIRSEQFNTYVEVSVAPSVAESETETGFSESTLVE
jgi:PBP1b-binding outer membrane lipoprotein LpoB